VLPNVRGHAPYIDENGQQKWIPLPFFCECGAESQYGLNEKWYCKDCYTKIDDEVKYAAYR